MKLPHSEACVRNTPFILQELKKYLITGDLLEMGFGTGQHAEYICHKFPAINWFAGDQKDYHQIFNLRFEHNRPKNLFGPIDIFVSKHRDLKSQLKKTCDYFFTANTLHIMNQEEVKIWCNEISTILNSNALLMVYGPFKYNGKFTSESNRSFDYSLRSRGLGSCIKDFEHINKILESKGLIFLSKESLPANNEFLVWKSLNE